MTDNKDRKSTSRTPKTYSAHDVRQADIVLRHRWQRITFISGLIGCALLGIIVVVVSTG